MDNSQINTERIDKNTATDSENENTANDSDNESKTNDSDNENKQLINSCKENDSLLTDFAEVSLNKPDDDIPSPEYPLNNNVVNEKTDAIKYVNYCNETQMPDIMRLIQKDLSEPYSIYTYRYFIHNWPQLCFLVRKINIC